MSTPLYSKHDLCEGRGCYLCNTTGYLEEGLTREQVETLVAAAQRLTFEEGDIARVTKGNHMILFEVSSVGPDGMVFGHIHGLLRDAPMMVHESQCRRVGRMGRKDGQPC